MDKVREEFEAWIKTEFDGCMPRRKGKGYLSQYVDGAWKAWQAAKASDIPEGFVLVPKDPTEKIIDAGSEARHYTDGHVETMYKAMIEAAQGE